MKKDLSITYIPRHIKTIEEGLFNSDELLLKQSFLDEVEPEFLHMVLCDRLSEDLPMSLIEAIMAYSDQHKSEKDVTVVFRY